MVPAHLYVHAPFCARRCSYCDFAVTVDASPAAEPWVRAVERELSERREREGWGRLALRTIYVGGGTPSLFGPGALGALAEALGRHADWDVGVEWTVEANPESFSPVLARDWAAAGVNRVSFGAQTFDPAVLRWMGRLHGPDGPARAVEAARAAGIGNLSVDLIFGVPARLNRDWGRDLEQAIALAPEHVSLYGLTAESGTPLGRRVREGKERLADEDAYAAEYLEAVARLGAAGFEHYEVSNFARPGRESRHNRAYWDGSAWLGLGPGAHSYLPPRRFWNVRDWGDYFARIERDGTAVAESETVDADAAALERVWLGLRTAAGVVAASEREAALARRWQEAGWAERDGSRVRLTARGWLLLDRLAIEYYDGLSSGLRSETLVARTTTAGAW